MEDLRLTDFPLEVPLPASLSQSREEREEVREWVLTVSVDQRVEQGLPLDQRGVYVGSLTSHAREQQQPLAECGLTGYPLRGATVQFESAAGVRRAASREDWNKFAAAARQTPPDSPLNDVLDFVREWCGLAPSYAFS